MTARPGQSRAVQGPPREEPRRGGGPCREGSLREAQPRGGPAGGGEVAGPLRHEAGGRGGEKPGSLTLRGGHGPEAAGGTRGPGVYPALASGPGPRGWLVSSCGGGAWADAGPPGCPLGPAPGRAGPAPEGLKDRVLPRIARSL